MKELDFDFHWAGPLAFLYRYERLLEIDVGSSAEDAQEIRETARRLIEISAHQSQFLDYQPHVVAAAALLLAIKSKGSRVAAN